MSRPGLVKKVITAVRNGRPFKQTVWVRPKEVAAAKRMKKKPSAHEDAILRLKQAKAAPKVESVEARKERLAKETRAERVLRRERTMTKWRRQPPNQGRDVKPTKQEVIDILETGRFALVSAGKNPVLEDGMSEEAQAERHEQLKKQLIADGYQFTQVRGKYGGEENSFLVWVHDATREDAIKLGEDYNQDSVIYGENGVYEAHFTNDAPPSEWDSRGHSKGEFEAVELETWTDQTGEDDTYTEVPLADGTKWKFKLPLFQGMGDPITDYDPGSRREHLYGVDDIEVQEAMSAYADSKKKKKRYGKKT